MKIIFSLIFSLFTAAFAFSSSTNNESKIKSCLAGVYASQMLYTQKAQTYASKENDLALNNLPDCDDVLVKIKSANKKSFLVEAKYQNQIWTIDSSKTMIKK